MERVGLPVIPLKGGPYDGEVARGADPELRTTFFPDRVAVIGDKGAAVYAIAYNRKQERHGEFSHMGTE